jgi:uncharacterized phage protein (TIGR02220 family)
MGASVRIEPQAFTDPRFTVLAKRAGLADSDHALIKMARVWSWCTERCRYDIPYFFLAAFFEGDDPATHIVQAALGEWMDCSEPDQHPPGCRHVRVKGTEGRIEWLEDSRSTAQAGGKARAATATRDEKGRMVSQRSSSRLDPAGPAVVQRSSSGRPAQSSAPSPSPSPAPRDPDPEPPLPPKGGDPSDFELAEGTGVRQARHRRKKPKPADPTADEKASVEAVLGKLSERSGRDYRPTTLIHARRIVRLLRDGYSELDLRMVVWDRANRWSDDERMNEYLRPSTLFGPEKFADYLAEAKAAYDSSNAQKPRAGPPAPAPSRVVRELLGRGDAT